MRFKKEAGFPQEGCDAYWLGNTLCEVFGRMKSEDEEEEKSTYAAPCVSEILKKLPWKISIDKQIVEIQLIKIYSGWSCFYGYVFSNMKKVKIELVSEKIEDVSALMWIELKKRGLL